MLIRSISTLSLSIMLAVTPLAAIANSDKPVKTVNVQFKPGSSSATYKGKIKGYDFDSYRFYAKKGQTLNINWNNSNPNIDVSVRYLGQNKSDELLATSDQILPFTGPYEVRVLQTRNGARKNNNLRPYTVKISITN
ncbi:hypothetical protein PL75_04625 [Neisseria arctica]|uniref:DNA breaking-rejoining protein n=1 Tax=Neisseria arctica TaxID=1470200 RepID=A0A0J0YSV3_9NEIS|nr:hypothetical protein [Neisseria arctica]KLT73189.1 hypothetical protein PL75_04625 [Neisseria arctica]UOO87078.1 hypothetical protein LVJ86_02150 [Neisseria arctica]